MKARPYIIAQEQKLLEHAWRRPTNGTYSDTDAKVGAKINKEITDNAIDIVTGRAPVSDIAAAVKRWKSEGGDKMRGSTRPPYRPMCRCLPSRNALRR